MIRRILLIALISLAVSGCATVSPEEMAEQIEENDRLKVQLAEALKQVKTAKTVTQRLAQRLQMLDQLDQTLREHLDQLFHLTRER